jgi:hypothetical protein
MIARTDADWQRLACEAGRLLGELISWQRLAEERAAEVADLRQQLASSQDQLQRLPNADGGALCR